MAKITITRALSELGTINNRISAAINGGVFVGGVVFVGVCGVFVFRFFGFGVVCLNVFCMVELRKPFFGAE
jgi:hypothetical protein